MERVISSSIWKGFWGCNFLVCVPEHDYIHTFHSGPFLIVRLSYDSNKMKRLEYCLHSYPFLEVSNHLLPCSNIPILLIYGISPLIMLFSTPKQRKKINSLLFRYLHALQISSKIFLKNTMFHKLNQNTEWCPNLHAHI
jgi:hypothetical protein